MGKTPPPGYEITERPQDDARAIVKSLSGRRWATRTPGGRRGDRSTHCVYAVPVASVPRDMRPLMPDELVEAGDVLVGPDGVTEPARQSVGWASSSVVPGWSWLRPVRKPDECVCDCTSTVRASGRHCSDCPTQDDCDPATQRCDEDLCHGARADGSRFCARHCYPPRDTPCATPGCSVLVASEGLRSRLCTRHRHTEDPVVAESATAGARCANCSAPATATRACGTETIDWCDACAAEGDNGSRTQGMPATRALVSPSGARWRLCDRHAGIADTRTQLQRVLAGEIADPYEPGPTNAAHLCHPDNAASIGKGYTPDEVHRMAIGERLTGGHGKPQPRSKIPGARADWAPEDPTAYAPDLGEDLELTDAEIRAWRASR